MDLAQEKDPLDRLRDCLRELVGHCGLREAQEVMREVLVTEAVLRAGSIGGGARLLKVSRQAIQQAVRAIEIRRLEREVAQGDRLRMRALRGLSHDPVAGCGPAGSERSIDESREGDRPASRSIRAQSSAA